MERRVLVAIFLSFLVLYGYQAFVVKPVPETRFRKAFGTSAQLKAPARGERRFQPAMIASAAARPSTRRPRLGADPRR